MGGVSSCVSCVSGSALGSVVGLVEVGLAAGEGDSDAEGEGWVLSHPDIVRDEPETTETTEGGEGEGGSGDVDEGLMVRTGCHYWQHLFVDEGQNERESNVERVRECEKTR